MKSKFQLGQLVATPGALRALEEAGQSPAFFLDRHLAGDWGEVDAEDKRANDEALITGERLLSAYRTLKGARIWIITEADRSSTCCLLPRNLTLPSAVEKGVRPCCTSLATLREDVSRRLEVVQVRYLRVPPLHPVHRGAPGAVWKGPQVRQMPFRAAEADPGAGTLT